VEGSQNVNTIHMLHSDFGTAVITGCVARITNPRIESLIEKMQSHCTCRGPTCTCTPVLDIYAQQQQTNVIIEKAIYKTPLTTLHPTISA